MEVIKTQNQSFESLFHSVKNHYFLQNIIILLSKYALCAISK